MSTAQAAIPHASAANSVAARPGTRPWGSPESTRPAGTAALLTVTRATGLVRSMLSSGVSVTSLASTATQASRLALPGGQDQQVGQARAGHGTAGSVDHQAAVVAGGGAQPRPEPHRGRERARRQFLDQALQRGGVGSVGRRGDRAGQHRAGQHGGQEPAGYQRAGQFLRRHRQFGQARALAAQRLRQVQAEQPLGRQARPQRVPVQGGTVVFGVHRRPDHGGRGGVPGPAAHRFGQCQVLFRQGQRHCPPHSAENALRPHCKTASCSAEPPCPNLVTGW